MVVPIGFVELLRGHPEILGGLPLVGAELHQPGGCGVPQNVRRHVRQAGGVRDVAKCLVYVFDRPAVPFDRRALAQAMPAP